MDEAANNIIPLTGSPLSRRSRENINASAAAFNSFISEQRNINTQKTRADDYQNVLLQGSQSSVTSLQNQLDGISRELSALSQNVNTISQTVQQQGTAEQLRLRSEQENQRRLAERRVAIGKENELEQRIQSSLASPIVAVQGKVSDLFGRVESAFTTLFLGWLSNSVLDYLKAQATGDIDKLNQIKGNILKGLAVGVGSLFAVKAGLSLVGRAIGAVTGGVTSLIAKLATAPFRAIGAGISALGIGAGGRKPPTVPSGQKPGGKPGGGLGGAITKGLTAVGGVMDAASGQFTDAALASGALLAPGALKIPFAAAYTLDTAAEMFGGNIFGRNPNQPQEKVEQPSAATPAAAPAAVTPTTLTRTSSPTAVTAQPTPAATPSAPMMPQASNLTMNVNNPPPVAANASEVSSSGTAPAQAPSQQQIPDYSSIFSKPSTKASPPEMKPAAQITPPPRNVNKAEALPEVQPNVIVATDNNAASKPTAPKAPPVNPDVPAIPSSNPDNFYILYSQLNYNVVV